MNKRDEELIEAIKERTKPADAMSLLKQIAEGPQLNDEQIKEASKAIMDAFTEAGNQFAMRAIIEGDITEEEFIEIRDKRKIGLKDLCPILQAHFQRKDGGIPDTERYALLTTEDSPIYAQKEFIKQRFKVYPVTLDEMMKELQEDAKNANNTNI